MEGNKAHDSLQLSALKAMVSDERARVTAGGAALVHKTASVEYENHPIEIHRAQSED